jgi:predicted outer membrane repeat protein
MKITKALIAFFAIVFSINLIAEILNVPLIYPTIQQGINSTANGDTILVQPGTYIENINFNGKNITVASHFLTTNDIHYIYQTIIDGSNDGSVVTFENGEDSTAVLNGFSITNGYGYNGGGVNCISSNPSLINLEIKENAAGLSIYSGGAGIYCENSNPHIYNTLISNNSSNYYGGGIYCNLSNPIISHVIIENNSANNDGGAIYCKESNPILTNVTIADNIATFGGGIYCFRNSNPVLQNTILWNNSPQEICFSRSNTSNSITISYSDLQNGESGIVKNNNGVVNWGNGNIEENPDFVTSENFNISANSPCINSGNPDFDNDSIIWENDIDDQDPDSSRMDIGANFIYDYQIDFYTNDNFGYVEHEVNFINDFNGFVFEWLWDFENDGVFDSLEHNPIHIYTQAGIYDIKLKVCLNSWHTYSDSLIISNLIVVQESQLLPPANVTINLSNNDVMLQWSSIVNSTYYLIYGLSTPNGNYEFVSYTDNIVTNFTHTGILNQKNILFYVVIAFEGTWNELNKYIEKNQKYYIKTIK